MDLVQKSTFLFEFVGVSKSLCKDNLSKMILRRRPNDITEVRICLTICDYIYIKIVDVDSG